jgi:hypothetical protein
MRAPICCVYRKTENATLDGNEAELLLVEADVGALTKQAGTIL